LDNPVTEKKAALNATNNAVNPNNKVLNFTYDKSTMFVVSSTNLSISLVNRLASS
jgi:hypothetical protein